MSEPIDVLVTVKIQVRAAKHDTDAQRIAAETVGVAVKKLGAVVIATETR
jgi:uncharacterized protein (UPF0212 family)